MSRTKLDEKTLKLGSFFSKKVKEERAKMNLSQRELSLISSVGLDTLRSIENNKISVPGIFVANSLVKALGGSLDDWLQQIIKKAKN